MTGWRQAAGLMVVAIAGVASACGAAALAPRDDGPAVTVADAVRLPTATAPPEEVSVTVTVDETVATDAVPNAPEEPVAEGQVYYIRYDRFEPDTVRFDAPTSEPAREALATLLAGPTAAQRSLRYGTELPDGPRILGFTIGEDNTARIDLSGEFIQSVVEQTPLGPSDLVAIYQLVYTVTARPEVRQVELSVEGAPVLGGQPLTRELVDQFVRQDEPDEELELTCDDTAAPPPVGDTPPFFLGAPVEGATVSLGGSIPITGAMRLPGDPIVVRILQYRTEVLHVVTAPGCDGVFRATLAVPPSVSGPITLEAYVPSADGTKRYQQLRDLVVE